MLSTLLLAASCIHAYLITNNYFIIHNKYTPLYFIRGHNLPKDGVDRYCIDLVCIAGSPLDVAESNLIQQFPSLLFPFVAAGEGGEVTMDKTTAAEPTEEAKMDKTTPAETTEEAKMDKTTPAEMTEEAKMDKTTPAEMTEEATMDKTTPAETTEEAKMDKTTPAEMTEEATMDKTTPAEDTAPSNNFLTADRFRAETYASSAEQNSGKVSQTGRNVAIGVVIAVSSMIVSGIFAFFWIRRNKKCAFKKCANKGGKLEEGLPEQNM